MKQLAPMQYDLQNEIKKCKTMDDLTGKGGLLQKLLKDVIQNMLEAEMSEHLGRNKYEREDEDVDNYRNGYSSKKIQSGIGEIALDVPRDRKSTFKPVIVKKHETVCNDLDKKIISMYAKGMSTTDDALRKSLYLATMDIMKKWSMPIANWGSTIAQFSIIFEGRLKLELS